jgi:toxin FitB
VIVIDTNVISELMRQAPFEGVSAWVNRQVASDLYLTAVTLSELLYGIAKLPSGPRRAELSESLEVVVASDFDYRILAFDETAAAHYADIVVGRDRIGRPISMSDAQIAAICRSHGAPLATRNVSDFDESGLTIINPWIVAV